jgi:hypothetical protein
VPPAFCGPLDRRIAGLIISIIGIKEFFKNIFFNSISYLYFRGIRDKFRLGG